MPICAGLDDLPRPQPLRVRADHEGFTDLDAGAVPRRQQGPGLLGIQAQRFFAQNMLARFHRLEGPRDVKLVGERVVDRLNLRIPQELFIRSIGLGDAELACRGFGFVPVARGDRRNLAPLSLLHARYHLSNRDLGNAQNAPPHLVSHLGISFLSVRVILVFENPIAQ